MDHITYTYISFSVDFVQLVKLSRGCVSSLKSTFNGSTDVVYINVLFLLKYYYLECNLKT